MTDVENQLTKEQLFEKHCENLKHGRTAADHTQVEHMKYYYSKPGENPDKKGKLEGFFCSKCKQEWLVAFKQKQLTINPGHDADDVEPSFCCIQVSDTGNYIKWKNINNKPYGLKRGDHVAWLRPILGYWHHAIVDKVTRDTIKVIEWSLTEIREDTKEKCALIDNCCYSPMYKAYYPDEILKLNPPDLVLMRARSRIGDRGYGPLSDNCEHFATFCKIGVHGCNQLYQLKASLPALLRKLLVGFFHLAIVVSFSEVFEFVIEDDKVGECDVANQWVGIVVLFVSELIYVTMVVGLIYFHDYRGNGFFIDPKCACFRASIKAFLQAAMLFIFAVASSVWLLNFIEQRRGCKWSVPKKTILEIVFGVLGGMVGNILGFFICAFIPCYPCCQNEYRLYDDSQTTDLQVGNRVTSSDA